MEKKELYRKAISKWGMFFQKLVLIEEMAELTQALLHENRNNKSISLREIASEMADVEILLEQIKDGYSHSIKTNNFKDIFENEKEKKLLKLKQYLKDDE